MSPLITQLTYSYSCQSCFWNETRKKIGKKNNSWGWGGWQKTWSLNVPNKGLQKQSQTLLSTSRLTTANGFLFKTLPNRKKGAAMYIRQPMHYFYSPWTAEWGQQGGSHINQGESNRMEQQGEREDEGRSRCRWDDWLNEENTRMSWRKSFLQWRLKFRLTFSNLPTKADLGKGPAGAPTLINREQRTCGATWWKSNQYFYLPTAATVSILRIVMLSLLKPF